MKELPNDYDYVTYKELRELREELYKLQQKVLETDIKQSPYKEE